MPDFDVVCWGQEEETIHHYKLLPRGNQLQKTVTWKMKPFLLNPKQSLMLPTLLFSELFYPICNSNLRGKTVRNQTLATATILSKPSLCKGFYSLVLPPCLPHCLGLSIAELYVMQRSSKTSKHHTNTQNTDLDQGLAEYGTKKGWRGSVGCAYLGGEQKSQAFVVLFVDGWCPLQFQDPCLLPPAHSWLSSLFVLTICSKTRVESQPTSNKN